MHYVIHALDREDGLDRRMAVIEEHRAYLAEAPAKHAVRILLSGPLTSDDGSRMTGSFLLVEAETREAVEAMIGGDPLASADVWESLSVSPVTLRQNNMGPA
jgi:uncharacterized protein YciI